MHSGPFTIDEGSSIDLEGASSTDDRSGVASTAWDIDGDGFDDGDPATFDGMDGPATHNVSLQVTDHAGNVSTGDTTVTVNNVAPSDVTLGATSPISEAGSTILTGSFIDPGVDDHTVSIVWGDGSATTIIDLSHPARSFAAPAHTYDDDDPTGTPSDVYKISVTITDDDGDVGSATTEVTVNNVAPEVTASGSTIVENGEATVSGTITDPGSKDSFTVVIDWGEGDPQTYSYGAGATSYSETHQYLDDNPTGTDGDTYDVSVEVTDDDGGSGNDSTTVTVDNVDPALALITASSVSIVEGDPNNSVDVAVDFTDPGSMDTHTAAIDCGDPLAVVSGLSLSKTSGNGDVTATCTYGDNGNFTITLTVTDDDGGSDNQEVTIAVGNVDPELTLDTAEAITFTSGAEAFIGRQGLEQSHDATAYDPGSDDLTFSWNFGGTTTYFNNGVDEDDPNSPSPNVNAITETDTGFVTFSQPGMYTVEVTVDDDDDGDDWDGLDKLVTGDCDCTKSQGYWKQQFKERKKAKPKLIDEVTLLAYLDIIRFASGIFGEDIALSAIADANNVFDPPKSNNGGGTKSGTKGQGSRSGQGSGSGSGSGSSHGGSRSGSGSGSGSKSGKNLSKKRENAEKQTLAAWLNFAYGAIDWTEMIDTDKDGVPDMMFGDLIGAVENILADEDATANELERAKDLAEAVNKHDKDNSDCDTKSGSGSGSGSRSSSGSGSGSKSRSGTGSTAPRKKGHKAGGGDESQTNGSDSGSKGDTKKDKKGKNGKNGNKGRHGRNGR